MSNKRLLEQINNHLSSNDFVVSKLGKPNLNSTSKPDDEEVIYNLIQQLRYQENEMADLENQIWELEKDNRELGRDFLGKKFG